MQISSFYSCFISYKLNIFGFGSGSNSISEKWSQCGSALHLHSSYWLTGGNSLVKSKVLRFTTTIYCIFFKQIWLLGTVFHFISSMFQLYGTGMILINFWHFYFYHLIIALFIILFFIVVFIYLFWLFLLLKTAHAMISGGPDR